MLRSLLLYSLVSLVFSEMSGASEVSGVQLSLWSEATPYSALSKQLPEFKKLKLALNVAVHESEVIPEDFFRFYAAAQKAGVEVRPWLLLEKSHGYWLCKWNVDVFEKFVRKFVSAMHSHGLQLDLLIFDIEPPAELMHRLEKADHSKDFRKMLEILRHSSEDGSILTSQRRLRSFVESLQKDGLRVQAVTTPLVLHDFSDQDHKMKIQSALGVPIQGIPWNNISFMVYRQEYIRMLGDIGADVVYQYGKLAKKYFSAGVSLALGEVGAAVFPDVFTGYTRSEQLQIDLEAGEAAGISRFQIYSLEGLASLKGQSIGPWLQVPTARIPSFDVKTRLLILVLDILASFLPAGS